MNFKHNSVSNLKTGPLLYCKYTLHECMVIGAQNKPIINFKKSLHANEYQLLY